MVMATASTVAAMMLPARPAMGASWREGITGRTYLLLSVPEALLAVAVVLVGFWWMMRSATPLQAKQHAAGDDL